MRKAIVKRNTKETRIRIDLNLDGHGKTDVKTGIPFMDHMLDLFGKHGLMDMKIRAVGDLEVDDHHTVEDLGIAIGETLDSALGTRKGIRRFGESAVPLDEALVRTVIDFSGRPFLVIRGKIPRRKIKKFDPLLVKDFLNGFVSTSRTTLHVDICYADNAHHALECIFKSLGRACASAVEKNPRIRGVQSTKGKL